MTGFTLLVYIGKWITSECLLHGLEAVVYNTIPSKILTLVEIKKAIWMMAFQSVLLSAKVSV